MFQYRQVLVRLPGISFMSSGFAQTPNNFGGSWALMVANRPMIVVTLRPSSRGPEPWVGWLASPKHFEFGKTRDSFRYSVVPGVRAGSRKSSTAHDG
jgi:hypothetical protein